MSLVFEERKTKGQEGQKDVSSVNRDTTVLTVVTKFRIKTILDDEVEHFFSSC